MFRESVNNNEDGVRTVGGQKCLDEIHGDGVPGAFGDWKLFKEAIGLVPLGFRSHAGGAGLTILLNKIVHTRPSIVASD